MAPREVESIEKRVTTILKYYYGAVVARRMGNSSLMSNHCLFERLLLFLAALALVAVLVIEEVTVWRGFEMNRRRGWATYDEQP